MDSVACKKVQPVVRKVKKKQVKGELDHLKRAEKKKRRLEKALATSAAIRSELEKKKQKKKEEQQRLDEEGAAIAEAVALQVLLGEDSDDSCKLVLNKQEGLNSWGYDGNVDIFMGEEKACTLYQGHTRHSLERIRYGTGCRWGDMESGNWRFSYGSLGRDLHLPYFEDRGWGSAEFSMGLLAAQAVSSLQIADVHDDSIIFNGLLRG
uniref:Uncharacterized protein n=1 Tax=Rhizophora mucronata TaxID=61149 RepID=A0A2P2KL38_RHIMU